MTVASELNSGSGSAVWLRRGAATVAASFTRLMRPARFHPTTPWLLPPRQLALAAAAFVAVFLLGLVLLDAAAITAARQLPRWLISFFDWITDFGKSGWFLWPLGILFLGLAALPSQGLTRISQGVLAAVMVRVGFLFTAIAVPGLFVDAVKQIIGRARPFVGGTADPYLFRPFTWGAAYASLPSGHATTAFAVLAAFGVLWPRARTILLVYALLIAISRVVVTAHHPTDVLAGATVGMVGVVLVRRYFALRALGFFIGPDEILHQKPGPSLKRIKAVARELLT
ncbi:MAG TPA: phosphatase PAP2 family protein [Pseudolabrys sp.]